LVRSTIWHQQQENPMTLPEKLAAFRANFESGGPPYHAPAWVHEPMHRATAELIASGAAERALKVGARAPEFTLKDADGREVSSRELLVPGPLVVTFYRGAWCPYCNMDLRALQEALPAIRERGAQLVAISPQSQLNSRKSQRENKITFPILADRGNEVAAHFGLRFQFPDYLIELYRDAFKNDLARINDDPSWTLPMPARYVIGKDSVIAYAEVNPDYTRRPDPEELLPVLRAMQYTAAA
jgi:peroxiredoxin